MLPATCATIVGVLVALTVGCASTATSTMSASSRTKRANWWAKESAGGEEQGITGDHAVASESIELGTTFYADGAIESSYYQTKDGKTKHGPYYFWYQNGDVCTEGNYSDGKESGVWTHFWSSRVMRLRGSYVNGRPAGKWESWDEQGNLTATQWYPEAGGEDRYEFYWFSNGQLKELAQYVNGHRIGLEMKLHENGRIKRVGRYDGDGERVGVWKEFDEMGNTVSERNYDDE